MQKDYTLIVVSCLISSNQVEQVQKIKTLLKGMFNMLEKYKKLLSWITALSNVVFLNVNGMNHLRGREYIIPMVDQFPYILQSTYQTIRFLS